MYYIHSEEQFNENILKRNKSLKGVDTHWIVIFGSSYNENCIYVKYFIIFIYLD